MIQSPFNTSPDSDIQDLLDPATYQRIDSKAYLALGGFNATEGAMKAIYQGAPFELHALYAFVCA